MALYTYTQYYRTRKIRFKLYTEFGTRSIGNHLRSTRTQLVLIKKDLNDIFLYKANVKKTNLSTLMYYTADLQFKKC